MLGHRRGSAFESRTIEGLYVFLMCLSSTVGHLFSHICQASARLNSTSIDLTCSSLIYKLVLKGGGSTGKIVLLDAFQVCDMVQYLLMALSRPFLRA